MGGNKVSFKNSKGDELSGILTNLTGDKSKPIIIFAHGFSSSKKSSTYALLADELAKHGLSSLRFDFYGHGESDGKFEDITISEAVDDILQAINLLKGKGYKKIGLFGSSFGGISSIIAASKTDELYLLALKSPVSDYLEVETNLLSEQELEQWKEQGYRLYQADDGKLRLNYTFLEDFKNNNGYKAAPKIKVPTLIIHGDADEVVPYKQSVKTSRLIPRCKLYTVKGANHRYTQSDHFEQMLKVISEFVIGNS